MHKYSTILIALLTSFQALFGQALNMTLEGSWDNTSYSFNDCWGYTDDFGNEYAIIGSKTRVIFFDIKTPTSPVLLAEFTGSFPGISGANSIWRDFKTYDRYAYAVADQGSEGLMVFDLSDIHNGNISKVFQSNSIFTRAHNIFIDVPEGRLYIIGSDTQNNGLIVYDIKDTPSVPSLMASVSLASYGGYVHDAYVQNNLAYCSSGFDGLFVIDMSNPASPNFLSFDESAADGYNHSGWPFDNGNKMLVAEEVPTGLRLAIFDISNSNNISYLSSFRDPVNTSGSGNPTYHNPYMLEDYAVISSYEDGITIMNLTDTNSPFREAHYDTHPNSNYNGTDGCWGAYPYYPSGTIIGSDINTGLYILSTTLPLTNTCNNGIQDDFEIDIDCGGFCNTCECSAPRDFVFSDLSNSSIQIDWTAVNTAVGYEVRYRESGASTWTTATTNINMITLSGLTPSTTYEFQFRSDCGNRLTPYGTSVSYTIGSCERSIELAGSQMSGIYVSQQFIRSEANLQIGSDVEYLTGDSIILENPFEVDANTDFLAEVNTPCGIATFTGQNEVLNFTHIAPSPPEQAFSLVVNKDENVFYLVSNDSSEEFFQVELLDKDGRPIQNSKRSTKSKLLKVPITPELNEISISQGDKQYLLPFK